MLLYILKRLALLIPTLLGVITLVFFIRVFTPGNPAQIMAGERANKEQIEEVTKKFNLDKPLYIQYLTYLKNLVLHFDFGKSYRENDAVLDILLRHFPATIEISFFAMIFASFLGIIIGVISATKQYSIMDYTSMFGALFGVSMPVFWLGLVLVIIFSINLDWLPTGGRINTHLQADFTAITNFYVIDAIIEAIRTGEFKYLWSVLKSLILPTATLGSIPLALIARMTRSSMLEVLKQDFVRTARSCGLPEYKVIFKYALRNALLPVVTVIGLMFGILLGGAVLTETIFSWPGIGKHIYEAIIARDYPLYTGGIVFIATVFVLINLAVDLLYSVINPKIRTE